ncbi:MAG: FG-GAP-like repeat-containing protein [Nitrospiria bacterium]
MITTILVTSCGSNGSAPSNNSSDTLGVIQGTVSTPAGVSFQKAAFHTSGKTETGGTAGVVCVLEGTDKTATTDGSGQFRISNVPAGEYLLICRHTAADGTLYAFLRVVEAHAGTITDIGIEQITPTGRIQGVATLDGQTNHTGILVYVPGTSMQSRTDSRGVFLIRNIPEGTYELRLERNGYVPTTLGGITVTSREMTVIPDLVLHVSTGPTGTIVVEDGATHSNSTTVRVSITASEDAILMQISANPNFIEALWGPVGPSQTWTFDSDGEKLLYVRFADATGLASAPVSDSILIDTTPPAGTIQINGGAEVTATPNVTLSFHITDATTSVSEMMISNEPDFVGALWEAFSATRSWTLSAGDGTKTVHTRFKDLVGNVTESLSSSITVDPGSIHPLVFRVESTYVGAVSVALASGDVTGDASPDLVVGTAGDSQHLPQVNVLPGWKTQSSLSRLLSATDLAISVAIGDLNGDGQHEIVALTLNDLRVFSPDLTELNTASLGSDLGDTVSIAALNGGGHNDLVVGLSSVFPKIRILLDYDAASETGFREIFDVPIPGAGSTLSAAVAELNGDGNDDVVVAGGNTLWVLLGDGHGGFLTPQAVPLPASATRPVPADIDQDGDIDIVVPVPAPMGDSSVGGIVILRNDGAGSLTRMAFIEDHDYPQSVAVVDMNFDGYPDLAVADNCGNCPPEANGAVKVYRSDGSGGFSPWMVSASCLGLDCASLHRPHSIVSGDVNGDGFQDLAVADSSSPYIVLFLNSPPLILP